MGSANATGTCADRRQPGYHDGVDPAYFHLSATGSEYIRGLVAETLYTAAHDHKDLARKSIRASRKGHPRPTLDVQDQHGPYHEYLHQQRRRLPLRLPRTATQRVAAERQGCGSRHVHRDACRRGGQYMVAGWNRRRPGSYAPRRCHKRRHGNRPGIDMGHVPSQRSCTAPADAGRWNPR